MASGDFNNKDGDRDSTENGSSNGDFQPAPPGGGGGGIGNGVSAGGPPPAQPPPPPPALDASSMLAAREKTLISRAMDTVAKQVESMDSDAATAAEEEDAEEEMFTVEGKLLKEALFKFMLTTPSPMPTHLNVHFICETASRLLFLSIHWVRSIPAFSQLK